MSGMPCVRVGARTLRVPRTALCAWLGIDEHTAGNGHGPLPPMLTVEEAAAIARISRRQAYALANEYLDESEAAW